MRKTYRFIKSDYNRQKNWQKFMRIFRAYPKGVKKTIVDKIMGWA